MERSVARLSLSLLGKSSTPILSKVPLGVSDSCFGVLMSSLVSMKRYGSMCRNVLIRLLRALVPDRGISLGKATP